MDGLRIAQVSDVHLPGNRRAARAALEHLHRERPDIVVLTGDMTESAKAMTQVRDFAAESRGRLATIAILGNWEYFAGVQGDASRAAYRQAGVQFLVNGATTVDVGEGPRADLRGPGRCGEWPPPILVAPAGQYSVDRDLVGSRAHLRGAAARGGGRPAGHAPRRPHPWRADPASLLPPVTPVGAGRFLEGWYRDTFAPLYVSRVLGRRPFRLDFAAPPSFPSSPCARRKNVSLARS